MKPALVLACFLQLVEVRLDIQPHRAPLQPVLLRPLLKLREAFLGLGRVKAVQIMPLLARHHQPRSQRNPLLIQLTDRLRPLWAEVADLNRQPSVQLLQLRYDVGIRYPRLHVAHALVAAGKEDLRPLARSFYLDGLSLASGRRNRLHSACACDRQNRKEHSERCNDVKPFQVKHSAC